MKTNHERKVKCDSCNIEADNESSLKTHRQAEHGIVSSSLGFMLTREVDENCEIDEAKILHTFKNSFLVEIFKHRRELCGFFFQPILTQFQGIDVVDPGLEIIVCPHFYKLPRWWLSQNWRKVGFWFKNRRNEDWKKVKVWTQYAPHLKHIFLQGFEKGSFYISNPTHCENREVGGDITPLDEIF